MENYQNREQRREEERGARQRRRRQRKDHRPKKMNPRIFGALLAAVLLLLALALPAIFGGGNSDADDSSGVDDNSGVSELIEAFKNADGDNPDDETGTIEGAGTDDNNNDPKGWVNADDFIAALIDPSDTDDADNETERSNYTGADAEGMSVKPGETGVYISMVNMDAPTAIVEYNGVDSLSAAFGFPAFDWGMYKNETKVALTINGYELSDEAARYNIKAGTNFVAISPEVLAVLTLSGALEGICFGDCSGEHANYLQELYLMDGSKAAIWAGRGIWSERHNGFVGSPHADQVPRFTTQTGFDMCVPVKALTEAFDGSFTRANVEGVWHIDIVIPPLKPIEKSGGESGGWTTI